MDQAVGVQVRKPTRKLKPDPDAFFCAQSAVIIQEAFECERCVRFWFDISGFAFPPIETQTLKLRIRNCSSVIGKFHYVIKESLATGDVQDRKLSWISSGYRLEMLDALELPLERPV